MQGYHFHHFYLFFGSVTPSSRLEETSRALARVRVRDGARWCGGARSGQETPWSSIGSSTSPRASLPSAPPPALYKLHLQKPLCKSCKSRPSTERPL